MSDVLPKAVEDRIRELMRAGYSGVIELHFRDGNLRVAKVPRAAELIAFDGVGTAAG